MLQSLLATNGNTELRREDGKTALMLAAARGHKSLAILLLSAGAIIDEWDRGGETALILAAANGHESVVNLLLKSGAEVDRSGNGKTALMSAAAHGHESVVNLLLQRGAKVDQRGMDGETSLTLAAAGGHESIVNLLLEGGGEVNGWTLVEAPLNSAAANGHESIVNLLLERGAEVNQWNRNGETPLRLAAANGHESVVNLLLKKGAKFDQLSLDGETPLTLAATNGHEPVVNLLLERGADVDEWSWHGETPLMLAAVNGHEPVVNLLLERGAKVDQHSRYGETPLILAAANGHESVVDLLLENGAEVDQWGRDVEAPLTLAAANGHESVVNLLLNKGAEVDQLSLDGETPLTLAAAHGHESIVNLLLERGAEAHEWIQEGKAVSISSDKNASSLGNSESFNARQPNNDEEETQTPNATPYTSTTTRNLALLRRIESWYSPSHLTEASAEGHEFVVKMLLGNFQYGHSRAKESALIAASTEGHESIVKMLLDNLASGHGRAKESALIAASTGGHESVVKMLLDNLTSSHGRAKESALVAASTGGHESIVKMLLDNLTSSHGRAEESALITASTREHEPLKVVGMEQLYHEISYAKAISSAIFGAINGGGHEIIVRTLLNDTGSAVTGPPQILGIVDNEGRTVLHLAVLYGYRRIVRLLLDNGADVGIADRQNMTPLFAAAVSGATPIVLNPGINTSLADPSDNLSAFRLMKLQLGLYVLGQEDSSFRRPMDRIKFLENSNCLYEYTRQEIGAALANSSPFLEEQVKDLGDPFTSLIPDWGECLTGAHIRITMGSDFSAILRLDKFIGCGFQALGSHYIQVVVNLERKVGRTNNPFRLWEFLRASPSKQESRLQMQQKLAHNMALLYWTCSHEMKRARAVCNAIPNRPRGGNCWRDAFGDVLELRLDRPDPSRQEMLAHKQASHEGVPIRDGQPSEIFSTCVLSTLEDLTAALGIHSRAVLGDVIFLQGRYGTCVLIGSINHYPVALWHVCSIDETSLIASNPQQFVYHMGGNLICENSQGGQDPYQGNYSNLESLKGTILVGALVEPAWCTSIDTPILLQAQGNGVISGRTEVNQIPRLQFESLSGQAQFTFGVQGPQGTIAIGGGASRPNSGHIIAENSFSNSITTLERALRSWVLVYQTYNGQFVEQNLYCVVSCVLQVSHFRATTSTSLTFYRVYPQTEIL
jgi:ankyrin repeat protein